MDLIYLPGALTNDFLVNLTDMAFGRPAWPIAKPAPFLAATVYALGNGLSRQGSAVFPTSLPA
jgi:hypothetical protein